MPTPASAEDLSVTLLLRREMRLAKPLCCTAALRTRERFLQGARSGLLQPWVCALPRVESLLGVKGRPERYGKGYVFSYLSEHLVVLWSGGMGESLVII